MKLPVTIFSVLILLSLTSCFEILEEVNMTPDGSGTFSLTMNLSQSKIQLDKILAQDSVLGYRVPQRKELDGKFNNVLAQVKAVNGISNPVLTKDYVNYIFNLKCNFTNTKALNNAINKIWKTYDRNADTNRVHYSYAQAKFNRYFESAQLQQYKSRIGMKEKEIMGSASYTSIFRFQNEISSYTNAAATVSKSKRAIMFKSTLLDLFEEKKTIKNEIKLIQ